VAAVSDLGYQALVVALPDEPRLWPQEVVGMARYRDKLSAVDGVLLFGDRVVIPKSLRMEAHAQIATLMLPASQRSLLWTHQHQNIPSRWSVLTGSA
jgi:hypothetical protein